MPNSHKLAGQKFGCGMIVDFIPRKQLVAKLEAGWRLIPGHDYHPDEYAVLMHKPENPEPLTGRESIPFRKRVVVSRSNLSRAASGRNSQQRWRQLLETGL